MAKQELSQEEVWDDSALVNSWNEALEEYKKYHSLAVKGEKIELVLDKAESEPLYDIKTQAVESKQSQKDQVQPAFVNGDAGHAPAQAVGGVGAPQLQATAGTGVMPQALLNTVQDEGLKNMMMSWYYAGYYTGLYEGQQKAYANMQPGG